MSEETNAVENAVVDASKAESTVSKSKQKREDRKQEIKAAKKKASFDKIFGWAIGIVIAAVVIGTIVMGIVQSANKTVSNSDFSLCLNDDGTIKGNKAKATTDVESLVIPKSEIEFTSEDLDAQIDSILEANLFFSEDSSLTVADGDTINLDYIGSVDGVEFDGGNTQGAGATLVIGSGLYIDTFEQQLIGSHPGDNVVVNVTFPEEYPNNPDLAGKAAVFKCVVNSIQQKPEFTDAFVAENFSEYASDVESFKAYLMENGYDANLKDYIYTYISDNASATGLPSAYVKQLKALLKYNDEQSMSYYNYYYSTYYGYTMFAELSDYTGLSDSDYEKALKTEAKRQAKVDATYEMLYKKLGLTISQDSYDTVIKNYGENAEETYGKGFLNQAALKYEVISYLAQNVTIQ